MLLKVVLVSSRETRSRFQKDMKILIFSNDDSGLFHFRKELITALVEDNEVVLSFPLGGAFSERLEQLGTRIIDTPVDRRGKNPFSDLKLLGKYNKILRQENPDIVLTFTIKPNIYGGIACSRFHIPCIANVTGLGTSIENPGLLSKISLLLYRIGLRKDHCVFFQNESNYLFFKKKKIIGSHYQIIPGSGVNLSENCYEEFPNDDKSVVFLFIGRVMKDKGIIEFLESADRTKAKYPQSRFTIIGNFDEDLKTQVDEYCKNGIVEYCGFQNNVHQFIKACHCVVLPSYHEGLANVLLEAAACGRPVIASDIPGCQETFDEGISGFGCKPHDVESLVSAMEKFVSLPFERKKQMGLAGRRKVEKQFDRQIVVDSYLEEIGKVCGEKE